MAEIVGGFIIPHEPGILRIQPPWSENQQSVMNAYHHVSKRIGELKATTAIIIGSDHYVMFGPQCLPPFLIGIGEVTGPYEKLGNLGQGPITNNTALAEHIFRYGQRKGVDWSVSKYLSVDHSIGIPARLCALSNPDVSVIPIYLASAASPLIEKKRAFEVGESIRKSINTYDSDDRVVLIGSGGISHWIGMENMGMVNSAFDDFVIESVKSGNWQALAALDDDEIIKAAGNGALEIRNFLCAAGATGSKRASLIHYSSSDEWLAGLGFMELEVGHD